MSINKKTHECGDLLKKLIVSIIPRLTKIRRHTVRYYRSLMADGFDARSNSRNSDLPIPPTPLASLWVGAILVEKSAECFLGWFGYRELALRRSLVCTN